jgi:hypothetical protein
MERISTRESERVWDILLVHMDVKELYDARYAQLMKDKGIS